MSVSNFGILSLICRMCLSTPTYLKAYESTERIIFIVCRLVTLLYVHLFSEMNSICGLESCLGSSQTLRDCVPNQ